MKEIKKIVVVGPESTGKSTLCEKLAAHYNTIWVREYAREYLLANGTDYTFENLLDVAKGQLAGEEKGIEEANRLFVSAKTEMANTTATHSPLTIHHSPLFIDTDMYVMKVWCEFVFDKIHPWILNQVVERKYDLYLLCNVDAPWVRDELREYPDLVIREKLYHHYRDIMINQQEPWVDISGNYDERLQKAIAAIDKLL
jgi:nicotinamide riboside kinase